jgi:hypothetical protein
LQLPVDPATTERYCESVNTHFGLLRPSATASHASTGLMFMRQSRPPRFAVGLLNSQPNRIVSLGLGAAGSVRSPANRDLCQLSKNDDQLSKFCRCRKANYGRQDQQLPEDQGPGYMWRTAGITLLERRDGGVYVQRETIALSRGIPLEYRRLVQPLTERVPRAIMFEMLTDSSAAVRRESESISDKNRGIAQNNLPVTNGRSVHLM